MTARVLVVEDQAGLRDILARVLRRERFQVATAATVAEGRGKLEQGGLDVVLLDVLLPDGSGYDLLQWLRAEPNLKDTRVLMLSGLNELDDYMSGYEAGADDYLGKPFDFEDLVGRVKRLAEGQPPRAAA